MTAYGINSVIQKVWPDWTVVGIIGSGAYGEVYRAERLNGRVYSHSAIKVISIPRNRSEIDSLTSSSQVIIDQAKKDYEDVANGFADEIKLMESLKGTSNIVNIEDFKISLNEDGLSWTILIRMELLDPVQLDAKYSEEEIIELGIDICSALETCAKVGVIHRDIKPSNILINSFGSFKLGDFGIAKAMNQASFRMTTGKGTPNFMAPEVAQNGNYGIHGVRVDIYSLGQVLYYYLNRCRGPFIPLDKQLLSYKDRAEAYSRRMGGEALPAPIDASKEMAHLVLKACAFKPEDRFADATEMKAALNAIKSGTYVLPKEKKKKLSFKSSSVSSSIVAETETTDQVITNEVIDLDKTLTTAQPINDKKPKASKMRSKEIVKNRRDEKTQDSVKVENANIETGLIETELTETVLVMDPDKTTAVRSNREIKTSEADNTSESKVWRIVVALLAVLVLVFGSIAVYNILDYTKTVEAIRIINKPVKGTYEWGETLDTTGLELVVDYSFGKDENITSGFECSPNHLTVSGIQRITVAYQGEEAYFVITVKEPVVTSISISHVPTKTNYTVGDTLNVYGLVIEAKYSDSSKEIIESDFVSRGVSFTPTKLSTAGTQAVTVTYGGKTTSFNVTVKSVAPKTGTCGSYLTWKLTSDGTLTISGTGKMTDYSYDNLAPWYDDRSSIKSVIIEEGVTSIGNYTFYNCHSLTIVAIPDSVKSIGFNAFGDCTNLTAITIPDGVNTISSIAFQHSKSLNSINVSSNNRYYTSIDGVLFNKAKTELVTYPIGKANVSYIIPNGVTSIGDDAFAFCSNLTNVTIPDSVTSIDYDAFRRCSSMINIFVSSDNRYYASVDGALFNKSKTELIRYPEGKTNTSYTIPDSVTSIGFYAFASCSNLTNVTLPDSVTSINRNAFWNCLKIKSITIPTSVASIGPYAFTNWGSDQTIYIKGRTSAPAGWHSEWDMYCDAKVVWNP